MLMMNNDAFVRDAHEAAANYERSTDDNDLCDHIGVTSSRLQRKYICVEPFPAVDMWMLAADAEQQPPHP